MPRRFRFRIPRPYFLSLVVALAVPGMGLGAWNWYRGEDSGPLFLALCLVVACFSANTIRMHRLFFEDLPSGVRLPIAAERLKRLKKAMDFLPEETPPDWSPLASPKGTALWLTYVGDVMAVTYAVQYEAGWRLHVTLAHKEGAAQAGVPVPDHCAAEIFAPFRGVGEFVELDSTPKGLARQMPAARSWMALSADATAAQQKLVPPQAPHIADRPLNPHLAAVRRHLPVRLPRGWSVPLAITEVRDGWKDGAWMVETREEVAVVMLVASEGRAKLAVTIFHADKSPVNEAQAMHILRHFRGVHEFVQTDDAGDELEGARSYLGEIEMPTTKRAMLN